MAGVQEKVEESLLELGRLSIYQRFGDSASEAGVHIRFSQMVTNQGQRLCH
jgi:hypothetical protein